MSFPSPFLVKVIEKTVGGTDKTTATLARWSSSPRLLPPVLEKVEHSRIKNARPAMAPPVNPIAKGWMCLSLMGA